MKFFASKKLLSGVLAVMLAGGVLFAQTQTPSSTASEEAETTFTDMTNGERIAKLNELRAEQLDKGNAAGAAYLQGRIDFLNN